MKGKELMAKEQVFRKGDRVAWNDFDVSAHFDGKGNIGRTLKRGDEGVYKEQRDELNCVVVFDRWPNEPVLCGLERIKKTSCQLELFEETK
jgi:hypothetical protein